MANRFTSMMDHLKLLNLQINSCTYCNSCFTSHSVASCSKASPEFESGHFAMASKTIGFFHDKKEKITNWPEISLCESLSPVPALESCKKAYIFRTSTLARCRSMSLSLFFLVGVQDQKPWINSYSIYLMGCSTSTPTSQYSPKLVLLEYVTLLAQEESHNGLWLLGMLMKYSN